MGFDGYFGDAFGITGGDSNRNNKRRGGRSGHGSRRARHGGEEDHRARALAKQAWHAIELELGALSRGPEWNLRVVHVDAVGGGPLTVFISWDTSRADVAEVLSWLGRVRGTLRTAVATSITRKRVPDLQFVPATGLVSGPEQTRKETRDRDVPDVDPQESDDWSDEGGRWQ